MTTEAQRIDEGIRMENRCMAALIAMYAAQSKYVKISSTARVSATSVTTFTNEDLVRAMRVFEDDIRKVAAHLNVSKGCIYNRLRELPPGAIDGPGARKPNTYASDPITGHGATAATPAQAVHVTVAAPAPQTSPGKWTQVNGKWRRI